MIRIALAVAIALATHPAVTHAGCHVQQQRVVHKQAAVVHHQQVYAVNHGHHYQQQVVLKQVGYVPQYYTVGAGVQEEAISERVARKVLERIDRTLGEHLERHDRHDNRRGGFEHPGQKVAQQRCATCHTEGSAKVADGAPVLFNGLGAFVGNEEQAVAAVAAAKDGRMPPKGPELDDDSYFALKAYLAEVTSPVGK